MATLTKGFGWLSSKVSEGAKIAVASASVAGQAINDNVIKPTTTAIVDPHLTENVSNYVTSFGQKVSQVSSQGFEYASKVVKENMFVESASSPFYASSSLSAGRGNTDFLESPQTPEQWKQDLPIEREFTNEGNGVKDTKQEGFPRMPAPAAGQKSQEEWQDF
jgi:hypothetical protein